MIETVGMILGGLAVLALAVLGYSAWREKQRAEDAATVGRKSSGGKGEE